MLLADDEDGGGVGGGGGGGGDEDGRGMMTHIRALAGFCLQDIAASPDDKSTKKTKKPVYIQGNPSGRTFGTAATNTSCNT